LSVVPLQVDQKPLHIKQAVMRLEGNDFFTGKKLVNDILPFVGQSLPKTCMSQGIFW
jgi:hypothetical protein